MSEIIIPKSEKEEEQEELKYEATEADEEKFFLMYHLNFQPSEVEKISDDYRKWLVARLIAQKNIERAAMEQHRIRAAIGPDLNPTLRIRD